MRALRVCSGAQDGHCEFGPMEKLDLRKDVDVVLMRQDPPFHMGYITAAHLLDLIKPDTLVVNDPGWVLSSPEKVLPLMFPELQPPTLITRDLRAVKVFREAHEDLVIKPLYGHGGAGVIRVKPDDGNLDALTELFAAQALRTLYRPSISALGERRGQAHHSHRRRSLRRDQSQTARRCDSVKHGGWRHRRRCGFD